MRSFVGQAQLHDLDRGIGGNKDSQMMFQPVAIVFIARIAGPVPYEIGRLRRDRLRGRGPNFSSLFVTQIKHFGG